jgi:hypothetical protein
LVSCPNVPFDVGPGLLGILAQLVTLGGVLGTALIAKSAAIKLNNGGASGARPTNSPSNIPAVTPG